MEINERKYDMPNKIKNNDTLVSATDMLNKKEQEEYNRHLDKDKDMIDDLDNQELSEQEIL
jgi:hypothetical protein